MPGQENPHAGHLWPPPKKKEKKGREGGSDHKRLTVRLTTPPPRGLQRALRWARELRLAAAWAPLGTSWPRPAGSRQGEPLGPHTAPPPAPQTRPHALWPSLGHSIAARPPARSVHTLSRLHGPSQDARPNAPGQPSCRPLPASCPVTWPHAGGAGFCPARRHTLSRPNPGVHGPGGPISHWSASLPPGSHCLSLALHPQAPQGASLQLKL